MTGFDALIAGLEARRCEREPLVFTETEDENGLLCVRAVGKCSTNCAAGYVYRRDELGYDRPSSCPECGALRTWAMRVCIAQIPGEHAGIEGRWSATFTWASVGRSVADMMANRLSRVLHGPTGTGKSSLAAAIALHAAHHGTVRWLHWPSHLRRLREAMETRETVSLTGYRRANLLVVDEMKGRGTEWEVEQAEAVMCHRLERGAPVVVTSNCGPPELARIVGARVWSRLSSGRMVEMGGADRRAAR